MDSEKLKDQEMKQSDFRLQLSQKQKEIDELNRKFNH